MRRFILFWLINSFAELSQLIGDWLMAGDKSSVVFDDTKPFRDTVDIGIDNLCRCQWSDLIPIDGVPKKWFIVGSDESICQRLAIDS